MIALIHCYIIDVLDSTYLGNSNSADVVITPSYYHYFIVGHSRVRVGTVLDYVQSKQLDESICRLFKCYTSLVMAW